MTIRSMLLSSTRNPFLQLRLEEGEGEGGGGTPTPSPAPAPAPTPFLSDEGNANEGGEGNNAENGNGGTEGEGNEGSGEEQTEEQKAAAEEERRAALTDEERAEEDRRAALTDEEREAEDKQREADDTVPEEYADFEVPEGVTLDETLTADLKATAKELGLTQKQAQQLADLGVKQMQGFTEAITQQYIDQRNSWREAAQADKEFGGDKFQENLAHGKTAIETFGSPELKKYLDETGLGDHPEFLRFAINVGKTAGEHNFVKPGKPVRTSPFYDHPTSQGANR